MSHTLPEVKRAKADRRRDSKRDLKKKREKARNAKYAFVKEFTAEAMTTEDTEPPSTEENKSDT